MIRFAGAGLLCLCLTACGSINIPLGSLWGSSSETKTAAAKTDDLTTGSIASADVVGKDATATSLPETKTTATQTASATSSDKPFSLEAPAETTGSLSSTEPKNFDKDDHDAVLAVLSDALPEKGSANSVSWKNETSGYGGMIMPMAQLAEKNSTCRELLISYGKGSHKDWYKSEGCRTAGKIRLSDVQPWRKTR
ncbi:MAG: RT0821/Lpp0805 family surface protein [Pseudomonadota bacterium]